MKSIVFLAFLLIAGCDQPKAVVQQPTPAPQPTPKAPVSDFATITKIFPNKAGGVVVKLSNDDFIIYAAEQAIDVAINWRIGDEIFERVQDPKDKEGVDQYWNRGDGYWANLSLARRNLRKNSERNE